MQGYACWKRPLLLAIQPELSLQQGDLPPSSEPRTAGNSSGSGHLVLSCDRLGLRDQALSRLRDFIKYIPTPDLRQRREWGR